MQHNSRTGLEYEEVGLGDPILFIHGAFIAATFAPLMDQPDLSDYRLIRYHRRGHAGSDPLKRPITIERNAADATDLLNDLGIKKSHIVGHSYGGLIALQLALTAPNVVQSLILLEPPLSGVSSQDAFFAEVAAANKLWAEGDQTGATDSFLRLALGQEWRVDVSRTVPGGAEQAEADARNFFELEVRGEWEFTADSAAKLTQPVLYVWGSESPDYLRECGRLFQTWLPRTRTRIIAGTNHLLQMQQPAAVAAAIAAFIRPQS